jgi:hypothetical protein
MTIALEAIGPSCRLRFYDFSPSYKAAHGAAPLRPLARMHSTHCRVPYVLADGADLLIIVG